MPHTEQPATRDKARTRSAILEAAAAQFFDQGAGVSLADIAERAGISKGALLYHFSSRRDLERALIEDGAERFWAAVHANVDIGEHRPGMLLRAYIRTVTSDEAFRRELFSPASLLTILAVHADIVAADAARWRQAFEADGIDAVHSIMLRAAADGLALSADTPYLSPEELRSAAARLVELAEPDQVT